MVAADDDYDDDCGDRRVALRLSPLVTWMSAGFFATDLDDCRFLRAHECYHWDVCGNCFTPSHRSEDAVPVSWR